MILEAATLQIKKGMEQKYEQAFREASEIISSMKGLYITNCTVVLKPRGNMYY